MKNETCLVFLLNQRKMFRVGDRVKKTQACFYTHSNDASKVMIGNTGTIVGIRSRYQHTPNAYDLYIVQFDGKSLTNELEHHYTESSLELITAFSKHPPRILASRYS